MSELFTDLVYVGIIGSRRRNTLSDLSLVTAMFERVHVPHMTVIVSGGCPTGGDAFAEYIADQWAIPKFRYRSRWPIDGIPAECSHMMIHLPDKGTFLETPERWRAAKQNYERNTLIAQDSYDFLIACVAIDRTGGTEDTIKKWLKFRKFRSEDQAVREGRLILV